jgi:hypothetical protein
MHIRYMFFKVFFATMDIHLMFDNFGLKCTLIASFCVEYVFYELVIAGCSYIPNDLALSISLLARNSALNFEFRGLVLNL